MTLRENIRLALRAIASNKLRTSLTLVIIVVGISALITILTATEGINRKMLKQFTELGANTFTIKNEGALRRRRNRRAQSEMPPITMAQANAFKEHFSYPATISVASNIDNAAVVKFGSKKTNPNVKMFGVDDAYLRAAGWTTLQGRNFSKSECDNGQQVILLGKDVVAKIFETRDTVVGSMVNIGSRKYRVVGLLAPKGASQVSSDNLVMVPVINAKRTFGDDKTSYDINVMVGQAAELDRAAEEANGLFRGIRKVPLGEDPDFVIIKSDKLASEVIGNLSYIQYATIVIGLLTLIGAGIGLMNIMLVSVNERTREIGISKAIGANKRTIRRQFLTEAVAICMIGGMIGIVLGVILGNGVGVLMQTGFIMPWKWIFAGIVFTFLVGVLAGWYPSVKASNLDPVDALRYE